MSDLNVMSGGVAGFASVDSAAASNHRVGPDKSTSPSASPAPSVGHTRSGNASPAPLAAATTRPANWPSGLSTRAYTPKTPPANWPFHTSSRPCTPKDPPDLMRSALSKNPDGPTTSSLHAGGQDIYKALNDTWAEQKLRDFKLRPLIVSAVVVLWARLFNGSSWAFFLFCICGLLLKAQYRVNHHNVLPFFVTMLGRVLIAVGLTELVPFLLKLYTIDTNSPGHTVRGGFALPLTQNLDTLSSSDRRMMFNVMIHDLGRLIDSMPEQEKISVQAEARRMMQAVCEEPKVQPDPQPSRPVLGNPYIDRANNRGLAWGSGYGYGRGY